MITKFDPKRGHQCPRPTCGRGRLKDNGHERVCVYCGFRERYAAAGQAPCPVAAGPDEDGQGEGAD